LTGSVSTQVIAAAELIGLEQVLQYDPLKFAGHEDGDFFFMPKLQLNANDAVGNCLMFYREKLDRLLSFRPTGEIL